MTASDSQRRIGWVLVALLCALLCLLALAGCAVVRDAAPLVLHSEAYN